MQGIFDENKVAELIDLPKDEIVAVLIPYGYEEFHPKTAPRKSADEVSSFK